MSFVCKNIENVQECTNICDMIKVCVTMQKSAYDFPKGVFHIGSPSLDVAIHRNVIMYNIKFQNCSNFTFKITTASLNLINKFLLLDPVSAQESVVTLFDSTENSTEANLAPNMKVLAFIADKNCGTVNDNFGGGLFSTVPPFNVNSSDRLFVGNFTVSPGECCVQLILGIDQIIDESSIGQELLLERACLQCKGMVLQNFSCCPIWRNVILPGDCALRLERFSIAPTCLTVTLVDSVMLPPKPKVPLNSVDYVTNSAQLTAALAGIQPEIWVQQGIYVGPFTISRNVNIYGGFLGGETDRDQRYPDPNTNNTVLSGNLSTSVLLVNGTATVGGTLLNGFTITQGRVTDANGGGMLVGFASGITLQNVNVIDNKVTGTQSSGSVNGGGIALDNRANLNMCNVLFSNNRVEGVSNSITGGAIAGLLSSNIVQGYNVSFYNNHVSTSENVCDGGAVYLRMAAIATFVNCAFVGNYASSIGFSATGGAFHMLPDENGQLTLTNCTFTENYCSSISSSLGGALAVEYLFVSTIPLPTIIQNCIFWNNTLVANFTLGSQMFIEGISSSVSIVKIADSLIENPTNVSNVSLTNGATALVTKNNIVQTGLSDVLNQDPLFFNAPTNVRLSTNSPAINTGYNGNLSTTNLSIPFLTPVAVDLDMTSRIKKIVVDMGPYEFC